YPLRRRRQLRQHSAQRRGGLLPPVPRRRGCHQDQGLFPGGAVPQVTLNLVPRPQGGGGPDVGGLPQPPQGPIRGVPRAEIVPPGGLPWFAGLQLAELPGQDDKDLVLLPERPLPPQPLQITAQVRLGRPAVERPVHGEVWGQLPHVPALPGQLSRGYITQM